MFSKFTVFFVFATTIVSAMPQSIGNSDTTNGCNVGVLRCCQSIQAPQNQALQNQLGALNLAAGAIDGMVGVQCNLVSFLGGLGTGSNCNADPVCCTGNDFNGGIAVGCVPVNFNLQAR